MLTKTLPYSRILLVGGSGFIGSQLAARLAGKGCSVIVPTRRRARARHLLVLPGVTVVQADIHDDVALSRLVAHADVVINLVGILHAKPGKRGSNYGPGFARAHVALPRRLAAACAEAGVQRLLHMGALGAAADAPSMYLRSKAAGEAAVLAESRVAVTVFKPSVVFGPGDSFLSLFARLQKFLPLMLLGGAGAAMQPVYVGDVCTAFERALADPSTAGHGYELAGPHIYTLGHLVRLAGFYSHHPRPVIGLPALPGRLLAWAMEYMPGGPLMSRDNLDSLRKPGVASAEPDPKVMPHQTALQAVAPLYLDTSAAAGRKSVTPHLPML